MTQVNKYPNIGKDSKNSSSTSFLGLASSNPPFPKPSLDAIVATPLGFACEVCFLRLLWVGCSFIHLLQRILQRMQVNSNKEECAGWGGDVCEASIHLLDALPSTPLHGWGWQKLQHGYYRQGCWYFAHLHSCGRVWMSSRLFPKWKRKSTRFSCYWLSDLGKSLRQHGPLFLCLKKLQPEGVAQW